MNYNYHQVLDYILAAQNADGSFATYESYPVVNPQAGWTLLPDPSPFITANILYSLLQVKDNTTKLAIAKGAQNIRSLKQRGGYWRFWPLRSLQHPVPLDIDDTCLASYILQQCGRAVNNKNMLAQNKNADGYFQTWLTPRIKAAFINPLTTVGLMLDYFNAQPTRKLGHFAFTDYEPAVAANALLYLGQQHNETCIALIIEEVKANKMPLQFYNDEIVVYYHLARAYANGVTKLGEVKLLICQRLQTRFAQNNNTDNQLLTLMAANILLYFNSDKLLAHQLISSIYNSPTFPHNWQSHAYFCSKDRNFLAGSPQLTAALYVEACVNL